jgi:heme exporter protein A
MRLSGNGLMVERGERAIFSGVNFAADAGDLVALSGPNGSGKTTLLRLIAGLIQPQAGTVELEGGDEDLTIGQQAHMIGHQHGIKPALTVEENLRFWKDFLGGETVQGGLEGLGLEALRDFPAGVLSAGQRRRLSLARLLVAQRPIWLLDEPTTGLDRRSLALLCEHMRRHLDKGGIIIAATHGALGVKPTALIALGEAA